MANMHNVFIRILNSIHHQCTYVRMPSDILAFTSFISALILCIQAHHHTEETVMFPVLESMIGIPDFFHPNVEQHEAFMPGLKALEKYVKELEEGKDTYDGERIRRLVADFMPSFVSHLSDEIPTIEALDKYADKIDWKEFDVKVHQWAVKHADKEWGIPMFMTNYDVDFENGIHNDYVPFPWYVGTMFRWFYIPKHKDVWRFSACDSYGKRQELLFADDVDSST